MMDRNLTAAPDDGAAQTAAAHPQAALEQRSRAAFFITPGSGQEKHFFLSSLDGSRAPTGDSPRLDCIIHDASLSV